MNIQLSEGEAFDRRSILEIKQKRIKDPVRLHEVQKEIECYHAIDSMIKEHSIYYQLLVYVNEKIWDLNDQIIQRKELDHQYAQWTHDIFEYNMQRFRLKDAINMIYDSSLKEQKSYSKKKCYLQLHDQMMSDSLCNYVIQAIRLYDQVYLLPSLHTSFFLSFFPSLLPCDPASDETWKDFLVSMEELPYEDVLQALG